ncbi:serum response factor-like isoform X3 [Echeneis naucrates]|uniref:serum response factor-like isoform X3 n=1 Tax=Echeneis naucrates TaxID=173247 RepID=UPI001113EE4C|nr:serum response factor-like isoform X3 [Echeneis naucrates]
MLAGSSAGMGTRTGSGRTGNGAGLVGPGPNTSSEIDGGQFGDREFTTEVIYSGSDQDSDSGDDEDTTGSGGDRRGVKRERSDREVGRQAAAPTSGGLSSGYNPGVPGAKPGKKTRGRVKIKMEFIDNKLRRYTTFSKRKTGIMKKAYELSTLTGTQVLLLVASETGHVYTFATRKLQPMITSETGKALIQTCLNSPDSPPRSDPSSDQRMSATGFEETDLTYQVSEADGCSEVAKDLIKPAFTISNLPSTTQPSPSSSSSSSSSVSMQVQTSAPSWQPSPCSSNGTVLKTSASVVLPGGFTLMPVCWQLTSLWSGPTPFTCLQVHRCPPAHTPSPSASCRVSRWPYRALSPQATLPRCTPPPHNQPRYSASLPPCHCQGAESLSSCRRFRFKPAVSRPPPIRTAQTYTAPPPPQPVFHLPLSPHLPLPHL